MRWPAPDPSSPFFCHGPTLLSFSGGRTSAYMLWRVLGAHCGVLPSYVWVVFANTGREREETLRFVHECGVRWGVRIWWVEWRAGQRVKARRCDHQRRGRCASCREADLLEAARTRFEVVGFNSADREGETFAALMRRKKYLPNQDMRYCTIDLKIETMKWFMVAQGLSHWLNLVGLRADERARVLKQFSRNQSGKDRFLSASPLFVAGVTKPVVMDFWLGRNRDPHALTHPLPQGFDLGLRDYEGNCDLCFLKGRAKRAAILRDRPEVADWWIAQEDAATARITVTTYAKRFHKDEDVRTLLAAVRNSPEIEFGDPSEEPDVDCTGSTCLVDEGIGDEEIPDDTVVWLREYMARLAANPQAVQPARQLAPPVVRDLFAELEQDEAA